MENRTPRLLGRDDCLQVRIRHCRSPRRSIANRLGDLKPGEGLLAEWVTGNYPDQHRWVLVSGADESGLEKAALTLGCAAALLEVPPNPAVIAGEPQPALPPVAQAPRPRWKLASLSPFKASETAPQPPAGAGLSSVNPVLVTDKFLRKTAFLLPRSASGNELKLFFDLALFIGSQLPDSPLLWPQACAFSKTSPAPFERLNGRSVLLISPVTEWKYAVPPTTTLPLEVPDDSTVANVQGRVYELSSFEPSLALVHLLPSPWSPNDALIAAGGWQTTPPDTVKAIFREAAPAGRLFGNLGAMDALGRTAVCNTRQPMLESFAQLLQRQIPKGLSVEQTAEQLIGFEQDAAYSVRTNRILSWLTGTCLFLVVAARLLLTWERELRRRKIMRSEIPAGSL